MTRKYLKCLYVMANTQPTTQKSNFDVFDKISQKSAVEHSTEKSTLLSIVNFSTTFCPRLSEEIYFHF